MKMAVCPNDTIETSWISRYARLPEVCNAMRHIDGDEFYQKYLLKVKFEGLLCRVSCLLEPQKFRSCWKEGALQSTW